MAFARRLQGGRTRRPCQAVAAFEDGRDLDPQSPDWDKEARACAFGCWNGAPAFSVTCQVNRTRAAKELKEASSLQKARN